jgi:hypothetical protein
MISLLLIQSFIVALTASVLLQAGAFGSPTRQTAERADSAC